MKLTRLHSRLILCGFLFLPYVAFPDAVLDWNEVALARVIAAKQLPPDGARTMAMVHIGIFDAVNAVKNRYTSYFFKGHAPAGTSAEAAIAAAAHTILTKLFSDQAAPLESAYAASLAKIANGHGKTSGIELGRRIGAECLEMRVGDGTGASNSYRPKTSAGVYVSTALPVSPEWATVKPFFMNDSAQFRPGPPPALASAQWARDYNEIKELGALQSTTRTGEQSDIARFWTITGAPSWNPVVRSLAASNRLSLIDNARLFALVNIAATDAFIAVFDAKYEYNFWRPITAIRNGDIDGNGATSLDAKWLPLVDTPLHPEYPCAHSGPPRRRAASTLGDVKPDRVGLPDTRALQRRPRTWPSPQSAPPRQRQRTGREGQSTVRAQSRREACTGGSALTNDAAAGSDFVLVRRIAAAPRRERSYPQ